MNKYTCNAPSRLTEHGCPIDDEENACATCNFGREQGDGSCYACNSGTGVSEFLGRELCADCYNAVKHGKALPDNGHFADPGGNSALRAAGPGNPRIYPCPTCGAANRLTPLDKQRGYQCDTCADNCERTGGPWDY